MMPTIYHCPRCQTFQVKELERTIYCFKCELTFDKKFIHLVDDEDILAYEELEGIVDVFIDIADNLEED